MDDNRIPFLLIFSKQCRACGYKRISTAQLKKVEEQLYGYVGGCRWLNSIYKKYRFDYLDFSVYMDSLVHNQNYLLDSSDQFIRSIYAKARVSVDFREVAFMLCTLGLVKTRDYLKFNRDIGSFVDRFELVGRYGKRDGLCMSGAMFYELMSEYLYNMVDGVYYGYSAYDILWQMSKRFERKGIPKNYSSALKYFLKLKISDYSIFRLDTAMLDKYTEEVGLILPSLVYAGIISKDMVDKILIRLHPLLVAALLEDPLFILVCNRDCIKIAVS